MSAPATHKLVCAVFLGILYVVLFYAGNALVRNEFLYGVVTLVFLPAFVRLLGFLLVDYWIVPTLFLACLACVDLGLPLAERTLVAAFLAVGGPLGVAIAIRITRLALNLRNLTPVRLFWLSAACSLGNALAYSVALYLVALPVPRLQLLASTFIGDMVGTWLIIYAIKLGLDLTRQPHKL